MTQTMRAVLVKDGKGAVDALHLGETPKPAVTPGTVLVKVKAFGLNRMDIMQREGQYPGAAAVVVRERRDSVSLHDLSSASTCLSNPRRRVLRCRRGGRL
jgi:threonine dehydrogenase-like Zn-dependent dehydrogenase